jgi:hypothetical protein
VDLAVDVLALAARVGPGKPLTATVAAAVSTGTGAEAGRLVASLSVPDPWFFLRGPDAALPPVDAEVRFTGLPITLADGFAGEPGLVSGLLGAHADIEVRATGASPEAGTFRARVASPTTTIAVAARLEKGVVVAVDEPALEITATLGQAWLDAQLGPRLPAGSRLALVDPRQPLHVIVSGLRFPLPTGEANAEALGAASLRAEITVPDVAYSDPKTTAAKTPATLRGMKFTAEVAPGSLFHATIASTIEGQPAGEITADVRALDPLLLLAEADGLDRFRLAADVRVKSVPTGLVDALSGQDGLLVDMLGASADASIHSDGISMTEGTFTASFESPQAKVSCDRGGVKDKILYLEKAQGKDEAVLARAGLTPIFSERIIGSLVPIVVNVRQPEGAAPVLLSVEELRLPLDADLSKLDALVRIDLGEVSYQLLPGLQGLLGGPEGGQIVRIPELRVPIRKGVASYDGLPIRIGGRDYAFRGTFSLVDQSFKMETQVPVSALGKKVSDKLDSLRGLIEPTTLVPLELRGTWKSPKLRVGDDFLKKLAEDALKKQGGGLLDGLLKKKN